MKEYTLLGQQFFSKYNYKPKIPGKSNHDGRNGMTEILPTKQPGMLNTHVLNTESLQ